MKILIVEDEPLLAMMLEQQLHELGHAVVATASSVTEGIDQASKSGAEFAIIDVVLRGEESWPLAHHLHEQKIPFAFSTGYQRKAVQEIFETVPILSKPFDVRDLVEIVGDVSHRPVP